MAKDVNIHLKTTGAEQTKKKLSGVAASTKQVGEAAKTGGEAAKRGGEKGSEGTDKLSGSAQKAKGIFGKFSSGLVSWAAGLFGITAVIAGITKAINIQSEAMKEHARIATEQQKKLLALQAMGTFFEEHPEARKEVAAYAEFGRRPSTEVAEAWYALESKGAGLTEEQKQGIMHEALEFGRMEPEADLKGIVEMFSLYAKETREQDINLIQNVLRTTLSKAGAELSEVSQYLPQFQSLGIAAGLTGAEAAGLWAYATTRTGRPEKATVGLRNIFMALQGKGTPESQELLSKLRITPEMGFYEQMERLSAQQRAGKFGLPEAETIAMKENAALLLSMLTETQTMMQTIAEVSAAARPDIDIVRDTLEQIMGTDEIARLEEDSRQLKIKIENLKAQDIRALRWHKTKLDYETQLRKAGRSELFIKYELGIQNLISYLGEEPITLERYMAIHPEGPSVKEMFYPPGIRIINEIRKLKALQKKLESEAQAEQEPPPEPPAEQPPVEHQPPAEQPSPAEQLPAEQPSPIKKSPAEEEKKPIAKKITIPTEAAEEQIDVPVRAAAPVLSAKAETGVEPAKVPVPVGAEPEKERLVAVTHYYDNSIKYFPRAGDDLVGPRFPNV